MSRVCGRTDVGRPEAPRLPVATKARAPMTNAPDEAAAADVDADRHGHFADNPAQIPLPGWREIARRTVGELKTDRVAMMAAAIAFAALIAVFPALIAALSLFGLIVDPIKAAQLAGEMTATLPTDAGAILRDQIQSLATADDKALGGSFVIALVVALWGASGGISMTLTGINVAYDETEVRSFVRRRLLSLGLAVVAVLFFIVAIVLIAVVPAVIRDLGLGIVGQGAALVARWVVLGLLIVTGLAALYRVAPEREDAKWVWISPGALTGAVLWLVGSGLFSLFVNNFGRYNDTYGAVAGVVVLMLWLQLSAFIVLLGAEINAESERQTLRDTTTGPPEPIGQRGANPADTLPDDVQEPADGVPIPGRGS